MFYHWAIKASIFFQLLFTSKPVLRLAHTPSEKKEIFKMRYRIYVQLRERDTGTCDPVEKICYDSCDFEHNTQLFYFKRDNQLIASARVAVWENGKVPSDQKKIYQTEQLPCNHTMTRATIERFLISSEYCTSKLALLFITAIVAEMSTKYDVDILFFHTQPGQVHFYTMLGYRLYSRRVIETSDGIRVPLLIIPSDTKHFKKNCPRYLYKRSKQIQKKHRLTAQQLTELNSFFNQQRVCASLNPLLHYPLLASLQKRNEFIHILYKSVISRFLMAHNMLTIDVPPEYHLISPKHHERNLYVVLSGYLEVSSCPPEEITILEAGAIINQLTQPHKSPAISVKTATNVELLVIRYQYFELIKKYHQKTAKKVLHYLSHLDKTKPNIQNRHS